MAEEARLQDGGTGLTPVSPGWFVVNAGETAWLRHDVFGGRCVFESDPRTLGDLPDAEPQRFAETGIKLAVVTPGHPSCLYHAESKQEDFLVLSGACLAIIDEQERPLRAWDFVHLPPGTPHSFVATGDEPCMILMIGARDAQRTIEYPESAIAQAHEAGVAQRTTDPVEAMEPLGHWQAGRPEIWPALPFA